MNVFCFEFLHLEIDQMSNDYLRYGYQGVIRKQLYCEGDDELCLIYNRSYKIGFESNCNIIIKSMKTVWQILVSKTSILLSFVERTGYFMKLTLLEVMEVFLLMVKHLRIMLK